MSESGKEIFNYYCSWCDYAAQDTLGAPAICGWCGHSLFMAEADEQPPPSPPLPFHKAVAKRHREIAESEASRVDGDRQVTEQVVSDLGKIADKYDSQKAFGS